MLRHPVVSRLFLPEVNHSLYAGASRNPVELLPQAGDALLTDGRRPLAPSSSSTAQNGEAGPRPPP